MGIRPEPCIVGNQDVRTTFRKYREVKDGQWLGVSVNSQTKNDQSFAVVVSLFELFDLPIYRCSQSDVIFIPQVKESIIVLHNKIGKNPLMWL